MRPSATATAPVRYLQGIAVPATSVRPEEFFARTRRHTTQEVSKAFAGLGNPDSVPIRKSDILGELLVRFSGSLVVTGAGVSSTARWPYDLLKKAKFTANGQSNIISASGLKLKVRDYMARGDRNDRGVSATVGGTARTQGTLKQACEDWGVGSASSLSAGTYPVELQWSIPVADDMVDLAGAIFCATSSTDLTLDIDWNEVSALFTGGTAPTLTGTLQVISTKFSIPVGGDGEIVVPDLSLFHSLIESRDTAVSNGVNEVRLAGQGVGRSLLRAAFQVYSGAGAAAAPLVMNATNFGKLSWRYSGNETPDEFSNGMHLREVNERAYTVDVGGIWGFGVHEFAHENAFRDVVDQGTTSELRLGIEIPAGVSLTGPAVEYFQEVIFAAGAGA